MVTSLDGRSTQKGKGTDIHYWTSDEDKKHFKKVLENATLIIMGSSTYDAAKNSMTHESGKLRIIMTRNPEEYESEKIERKLEFTNENPKDLVKRLEDLGHAEGYLVGGAHTNTEFFKQNLVTELWQTLEPKILGIGNGIVGGELVDVNLELISQEKLNAKGTLLLKYKVLD
jgi:dihydrofolate reductase